MQSFPNGNREKARDEWAEMWQLEKFNIYNSPVCLRCDSAEKRCSCRSRCFRVFVCVRLCVCVCVYHIEEIVTVSLSAKKTSKSSTQSKIFCLHISNEHTHTVMQQWRGVQQVRHIRWWWWRRQQVVTAGYTDQHRGRQRKQHGGSAWYFYVRRRATADACVCVFFGVADW